MNRKTTKGNVFKDLGFTNEEAIALAMRVDLAVEIEKFIKRRKLTQAKAAEYFGVPQPKISKIVRGKITSFSIEYLVKMVAKAGKAPRISFARKQVAEYSERCVQGARFLRAVGVRTPLRHRQDLSPFSR